MLRQARPADGRDAGPCRRSSSSSRTAMTSAGSAPLSRMRSSTSTGEWLRIERGSGRALHRSARRQVAPGPVRGTPHRPSSPLMLRSTLTTSSALVSSAAPFLMSPLVPSQRGSSGEPGTANTSRPLLGGKPRGDERARPRGRFDDNDGALMPEIIRLRRGKCSARGTVPGLISARRSPFPPIFSCKLVFSGG